MKWCFVWLTRHCKRLVGTATSVNIRLSYGCATLVALRPSMVFALFRRGARAQTSQILSYQAIPYRRLDDSVESADNPSWDKTMISFEIPEKINNQIALVKMLAEQAMRPYSRYYDDHEHELPVEFVNMMWPFAKERNKRDYERSVAQMNGSNGNGNGSGPKVNLGMLNIILTIEMLSWGDTGQYLSSPTPALGGAAINAVGTPEQKARFLKKFGEGEPKWGSMAITETGAGSDNSSMRTTAVLDPDTNEWILNGEKVFITNGKLSLADSDGFCVVWATVDAAAGRAGIKSFVVEGRNPGVTIAKQEHKLGIRASDTAMLVFKDCRIPFENLLGSAEVRTTGSGAKGFKGAMKTFDASRPAVAASAMGIARAALELTQETLKAEGIEVDYRKPKHLQTGIERDLLEMEARYKAAWLLTFASDS